MVKRFRWVSVGDGKLDIKGFVNALKKGGYDGFLSLEDLSPMPLFEASVQKGLAYLKKLTK